MLNIGQRVIMCNSTGHQGIIKSVNGDGSYNINWTKPRMALSLPLFENELIPVVEQPKQTRKMQWKKYPVLDWNKAALGQVVGIRKWGLIGRVVTVFRSPELYRVDIISQHGKRYDLQPDNQKSIWGDVYLIEDAPKGYIAPEPILPEHIKTGFEFYDGNEKYKVIGMGKGLDKWQAILEDEKGEKKELDTVDIFVESTLYNHCERVDSRASPREYNFVNCKV